MMFAMSLPFAMSYITTTGSAKANDLVPIRYVTGYIQFWNDEKHQWDDISWAPKYRARAPLTITLRKDINSLVNK